MALLTTLNFPVPGFGQFQIPNAYCMVVSPTFDKLSLSGGFSIAVWKDQATRESFRTAQADFLAKSQAFKAADEALKALLPTGNETPDQLKSMEAASIQPRAAQQLAGIELQAAINACNAIQQIKIGEGIRYSFDALSSSAIVTNGEIDVAKCYAWLKAHVPNGSEPDFRGAQDG